MQLIGQNITARTSVTSIGRQFDLYDVIYHVQPCRWRNVVFFNEWKFVTIRKTMHFSPHKICAVKVDRILIDSEGIVHIFNLFVT